MSGPEHRHDDDRTGNGIVNHGPDNTSDPVTERSAGDRTRSDGATAGAPGPADAPGFPGPLGASGPAVCGGTEAGGPETEGPETEDAETEGAGGEGGGAEPAGAGGTLTALFGAGAGSGRRADGPSASGGIVDETALRRMMQGAVGGLEPAEGVLDHLQRAVPARRARRRQAVVGAAAAALLIGTAVPAFLHVANSEGSVAANPSIAGHGEQAQGGNGQDTGARTSGQDSGGGPAARQSEGSSQGQTDPSAGPTQEPGAGSDGSGAEGADATPGTDVAEVPACDPGQLGVASAEAGAPGADGKVYGSFRISNVSGKACSVTSDGTVGFQAAGAADPLKITVVQHSAGDPASGLPDPSLEPGAVLLKPAMAYEVRFAWVPTDSCPTTGGSPSPTPTVGDGGGGTGGTGGTAGTPEGASDTAAQFGAADETPANGSIAVTHTPETGAPTAETTIPHACAGTIYRTGVLDAS
ncbi:hypothetical protein ABT098_04275 [Streptomyces nitrosporeus]